MDDLGECLYAKKTNNSPHKSCPMNVFFRFPIWQYLQQPLFEPNSPPVLNPHRYWQLYAVWHLKRCFTASGLEHCWNLDYYQFYTQHQHFVDRHYFEESNLALVEQCWLLEWWCYGAYCEPREFVSDI